MTSTDKSPPASAATKPHPAGGPEPDRPDTARPATETTPPPTRPVASDESRIPRHDDPTRYGDWEIGGRCIDF